MSQSPRLQPLPPTQPLPPPTRCLLLGPGWPRKNHGTAHCTSRLWARPSALVLAVNPSSWILTVLPPHPGNKEGPRPGRIRARSLNDIDGIRRPFPWQTLRLLRNMVPAHLRKVMLMVIKGVYHEHFAVTYRTAFEHFSKTGSGFP